MIGKHISNNGDLPIVSMDTDHIVNYINMALRKVKETESQSKGSSNIFLLSGVTKNKVTEEQIMELKIKLIRDYILYFSELMRRALFLEDEIAKKQVKLYFEYLSPELLTNLTSYKDILGFSDRKLLKPQDIVDLDDEEDCYYTGDDSWYFNND
jgi:hypothetical protein